MARKTTATGDTPATTPAKQKRTAVPPQNPVQDAPEPQTPAPTASEAAKAPVAAKTAPRELYRYVRKAGYRPYTHTDGTVTEAGQIFESDYPNAIPEAFMDGWTVLSAPQPVTSSPQLPVVQAVPGGFDVYTPEGRKLNDRPLSMKAAQELVNGLNP